MDLFALAPHPQDDGIAASSSAAGTAFDEAVGLVELIDTAARELLAVTKSAAEWEAAARRRVLGGLDRASGALVAAKSDLLVAEKKSLAWAKDGARSFEDWRGRASRQGRGAARTELARAETMATLEGGREALADGDLTGAHLAELDKVTRGLPAESRERLSTGDGAQKVRRLAKKHDARTFGDKLAEEIARNDPKDTQARIDAIRSRRHLRVSHGTDGTRISGVLDPVDGHLFQIALEAAQHRPGIEDTRTPDQRNADALADIARAVLDEGTFKGGAHVRPHLSLVMSDGTLAALAAHLGAAPGTDDAATGGAGTVPGGTDALRGPADTGGPSTGDDATPPPVPVVRLDDGPVLPLGEIERILCSVEITRVVLDSAGEPVDLGRTRRLHSTTQRRAILARDSGCAWDGCTTPARWCEAHHIDWWHDDHGGTDIQHAVALCTRHHRHVHDNHLDVIRGPAPPGPKPPRPGDPDYVPPTYTFPPRQERQPRVPAA